jgi:hypothetical protein
MRHRNTCSGLRQSDQDNSHTAATQLVLEDMMDIRRYHITTYPSHRLNDELLLRRFRRRSDQTGYRMASRNA